MLLSTKKFSSLNLRDSMGWGFGRDIRMDMLSMASFCVAINNVLIKFCDEGQSHADLWIRVRGAIKFLDYFSEQNLEQKERKPSDLPKYGFRGEEHRLTYEQFVTIQEYLKSRQKMLLETKKKLPIILDLKIDMEKRRAAAARCVKLFSGMSIKFLWYFEQPPNFGTPKGILELCEKSRLQK